jgi:hypothetical protein
MRQCGARRPSAIVGDASFVAMRTLERTTAFTNDKQCKTAGFITFFLSGTGSFQ